MTPREKAEELFTKFNKEALQQLVPLMNRFGRKEVIKQCTRIAADEMLNNAGFIWGGTDSETGLSARDAFREYWNKVKQEIEKL